MERRRAQLIHIETAQPVDPNWAPLIAISEIQEANRLLAVNQLQWRWRWLPTTVLLSGTISLQAVADRAAS